MRSTLLILAIATLTCAGCGGGGGGGGIPTIPDTTPRPDLVVTSMTFSPDPPTTAGFRLTVTVVNNGLADSPATTLVLSQIDGSVATPLSTDPIPALSAIVPLVATQVYTFPSGVVSAGTLTLRAVVTPVASETATGNNTMQVSTLLGPSGGG